MTFVSKMSNIQLENISISINENIFIKNLSLELKSGDILSIVGNSGSGKTLLAMSIAGIIQNSLKLDGKIKRDYKKLAILFQNPTNQLFSINVYEELKNSILQMQNSDSNPLLKKEANNLNQNEKLGSEASNLNEILNQEAKKWGVYKLLDKRIDKLSLGEAQQVALASIMISKPDLIILDEPAQYIDEESFNKRFLKIKEYLPNSIIIIVEHNYTLINKLTNKIIKLDNSENKFSFINKLEIPFYEKFNLKEPKEKNILEIKDLEFSYGNPKDKLIDIKELIIKQGEFLYIKGKNGSGKSTLIKIIIRLLKQNKGDIFYYNKNIKLKNPKLKKIRGQIAYIFQNPDNQIFTSSVKDEIYYPKKVAYKNNININTNIENWIDKFSLRKLINKSPHILSFGERRRVNILSAISSNPQIIIYDEPSTGLDYENKKILLDFIKEQNLNGITQFLISHDKWFIDKILFKKEIQL